MNKYEYNKEENEMLTEVRVDKVWLKEDLLSKKSVFKRMYPDAWKLINEGIDVEDYHISELKQIIVTNDEQFIIMITTESNGLLDHDGRKVYCKRISQKAFLTDKRSFIDITMLMGFTNLVGCRFQHLHSPFEDFVNDFIGEVFLNHKNFNDLAYCNL
jgi:hypothetical protein